MLNGIDNDALMVSGQAISLRTLVTDRLRLAIVTGRFRPGRQLRERELCELTGVSRPSLREALRQLEAEGLIVTIPHKGPVVTALTVGEVGHLYTLRRLLESFAAREFARLRRPDDIRGLEAAAARLDEVETEGTPLDMLEAGTTFYAAIATGSANPYLAHDLRTLHNRITLIRFISLHQRIRVTESFTALRELSNAIIAGDETRAERLSADHLDAVTDMAKAIVAADYSLPADMSA